MKIGLYGGSFDIIHVGHLMLAEYACDAFDLDEVYFIPDGKSSYGDKKFLFNKNCRELCIRLSIKDNPKFFYSPKFINSTKETKALDIVNHFKKFLTFFIHKSKILLISNSFYSVNYRVGGI